MTPPPFLEKAAQRVSRVCARLYENHSVQRTVFLAAGFLALCWFLIRVIPKPQRATYPCQRAAFPLASSFVIWLSGLFILGKSSRLFLRHAGSRRYTLAFSAFVAAAMAALWVYQGPVLNQLAAAPSQSVTTPNAPVGEGKGAVPGRVVWVHDPAATDWDGDECGTHWADPQHTDMAVVETMFQEAILQLAGETDAQAAWQALFVAFNEERGRGERGYQPGEKIMIKSNLTTTAARNNVVNLGDHRKNRNSSLWDNIDPAPQLTLALLRHLVHVVGVAEKDITLGDPTTVFPKMFYDVFSQEFPDIRYLDNLGGAGRTRSDFSEVPFHWSTSEADGKLADFVPVSYAEAEYLINLAVLKTHGSGGVTVCAKNHFGSLLRCPDGLLRDTTRNYYHLHYNLPKGNQGTGKYRALVDLMGHPELGGKTFLCIIDGLYGGQNWSSVPEKWQSAPFNGDWPSSIFVSQDQVAVDSVAYDFLRMEFPEQVAVWEDAPLDYLIEAATADNPPSGTVYDPAGTGQGLRSLGVQENWNNAEDKQYSRNLGTGEGIELVYRQPETIRRAAPACAIHRDGDDWLIYFQGMQPGQQMRLESTADPSGADWRTREIRTSAGYGKRIREPATGLGERSFYRVLSNPAS